MRHFLLCFFLTVAVAIAGCSSDGDDGASSTSSSALGDSEDTAATAGSVSDVERTEMGRVDVGVITNLPTVEVSWDSSRLETPEPQPLEVFLAGVSIVDDQYVAVANGWTPPPGHQVVYTWWSTDGVEWESSALEVARGESINRVLGAGDHLVAVGDRSTAQAYIPVVYLWDGIGGWDLVDLTTTGAVLEGVEIVGAASTEAGIVLGGRRDQYDSGSVPIRFQADEFEFTIDDVAGTYTLTEIGSGRLRVSGQLSEIYRYLEGGQPIYDMDSRELITVVPWELWERQPQPVSPLPIPIPEPRDDNGSTTAIEWDGYEVTVNEEHDSFTVIDQSTGGVVTTGSIADLYRGPSPAFVDPDSGEILISFAWEEWWSLNEAAHASATEPHRAHPSQQVVLFSTDGTRWSEQILAAVNNAHIDAVLALGGEFVVTVVEHLEFGAIRRVFVSNEGVTWTETPGDGPQYLYDAESGAPGGVAVTDVQGNSAVAITADGRSWSTELFLPPQSDGRHGWLRHVGAGGLGRAGLATINPGPDSEILIVNVGSRTARFSGSDSAVQITDDATGDILLELSWPQLEDQFDGAAPTYATYADGATTFRTAEGGLVMTITDAEALAALDAQEERRQAGVDHVLFIQLSGDWFEAQLPSIGRAVPDQLAVGDDVVIVGTNTYDEQLDGPADSEIGILMGRIDRAPGAE